MATTTTTMTADKADHLFQTAARVARVLHVCLSNRCMNTAVEVSLNDGDNGVALRAGTVTAKAFVATSGFTPIPEVSIGVALAAEHTEAEGWIAHDVAEIFDADVEEL